MKKVSALLLAAVMIFTITACQSAAPKAANDGLTIVTTIFPPYDFAREITQGKAEVKQLLPPGAESHTFEPAPQDIITLQNCDLFIYTGGESDVWIDGILASMGEKAPKTLKMLDCVDAVTEEFSEGMQHEDEEGAHEDEHDHEDEEYDEHVWTSPRNAVKIAKRIAEEVAAIDPANADFYKKSADDYTERLNALDKKLTQTIDSAKRKTIVVGDRFPFRYLAEHYGLEYYAAFPGCSSDSDASASTVVFLTDKVVSENIPAVLYIEFSNHKVADAIASSAKVGTELLHSCHNVTDEQLKSGASYISLMEQNIEVLNKVLN